MQMVKIRWDDVLLNEKLIRHIMKKTQSKSHRIGTSHASKKCLSCFDYKRYISGGDLNSLAYILGYKKSTIQNFLFWFSVS